MPKDILFLTFLFLFFCQQKISSPSKSEINQTLSKPPLTSGPPDSDIDANRSREITGEVFITKSTCIAVLKVVLEYITSKLKIGNQDQIILCCKVKNPKNVYSLFHIDVPGS